MNMRANERTNEHSARHNTTNRRHCRVDAVCLLLNRIGWRFHDAQLLYMFLSREFTLFRTQQKLNQNQPIFVCCCCFFCFFSEFYCRHKGVRKNKVPNTHTHICHWRRLIIWLCLLSSGCELCLLWLFIFISISISFKREYSKKKHNTCNSVCVKCKCIASDLSWTHSTALHRGGVVIIDSDFLCMHTDLVYWRLWKIDRRAMQK